MSATGVSFMTPRPADAMTEKGLLDEVIRRTCRYFYDMADPKTGLVLDRGMPDVPYAPSVSSIAATGFGLSALAIADKHHLDEHAKLVTRARTTLKFLCDKTDQEHGFFYHFLDSASGKRIWKSEASSIDTAWLLCGALHSRAYWLDDEIHKYSAELINRADWQWMLNDRATLCHGWTPESGFLKYRWDSYAELLAMYLLAMSSEKHAIPEISWNLIERPTRKYEGISYIDALTPLFVHQYSHAWFDFRGLEDRFTNYYLNSVRATEAHRLYCMGLSKEFPWYGPDMWGVTASDSPTGYRTWVSPSSPPDGTLVPCAAGGSLVFLPDACTRVLHNMHSRYPEAWSKYGFVDAFHPKDKWYSKWVLGIDAGIMLLMAENLRGGSVWSSVMSTPEAKRGMEMAGFDEMRS